MWSLLKSIFSQDKEPPPIIPENFTQVAPDEDSADTLTAGADLPENDDISGMSFGIQYKDAAGRVSERWVTAFQLDGRPPEYLQAHCHTRNALRTFRLDRVALIFDQNGEIIEETQKFFNNFNNIPTATGDGKRLLKVARDGVIALVSLSKSDGEMREEEIAEIVGYIEDIGKMRGMEATEEERAACDSHVRRMRPRITTVEKAVKKIASGGSEEIKILLHRAQKLIEADGKIHPAEFEVIMKIQQGIEIAR